MKEELLQFLKEHQPMPDCPTAQQWSQFKKATLYFYDHPAEEAIPLFLNAFGNWENDEICESVQATLGRHSAKTLAPHLVKAMESNHFAVRLWAADTARFYPHDSIITQLSKLLKSKSVEIRLCASAALEANGSRRARSVALERLKYERDEDVADILRSV